MGATPRRTRSGAKAARKAWINDIATGRPTLVKPVLALRIAPSGDDASVPH
jgi:hypothetical protein